MSFALDPRLAAETNVVGELALSRLLLMDDARWPWLILVPRVAGAVELIDLDSTSRQALMDEVTLAGRALQAIVQPDKLNVASLGNVVAQLHVHVVARFVTDVSWPAPIWGRGEREPYSTTVRRDLLERLRGAFPDGSLQTPP